MRLRELRSVANVRSVLITSPQPRDGKSTVALNMATALAEGGKNLVLLLEADLRLPSLGETLGMPLAQGLAECIEGDVNPMSLVRRLEPLGCYFLPAGSPQSNPSELLQTERFGAVMQSLCLDFDWVVMDSAPVNILTDTVSLAHRADTCLLVVRADVTPKAAVEHAFELLGPKNILGIVFNGAKGNRRLYDKYAAYYRKK
jgi:capsular exopolysaccharide synthesis family protein